MIHFLVYGVLGLMLVMLVRLTYHFNTLSKAKEDQPEPYQDRLISSQNFNYAALVLIIVLLVSYTYVIVKGVTCGLYSRLTSVSNLFLLMPRLSIVI